MGSECLSAKVAGRDVKRNGKYEKFGQWLCETCVADQEKP